MILAELQQTIFLDRYALKDSNGQPLETDIRQMWRRIADAIGNDFFESMSFYGILYDFRFVPGGRIMAGAGAEAEKTFYNCYVIPVETEARRVNRSKDRHHSQRYDAGSDSREAIFDTMRTMVDIMSRGGGVGINWSVLRPSGSYLTRVSGTSSGPVGWMDVASTAVGEVIQGGSRRGAAMFMLDDWHPDVISFIDAKLTKGKITNANISVSISDEFMAAVKDDLEWELVFPDTTFESYDTEWDGDLAGWVRKGYPVRVYHRIMARQLFERIGSSAHASGEPGVVFLGRYNALSTANGAEHIISVNPCGEQGLGAYSVCNLGAMNLDAYVEDGVFLWSDFSRDTKTAIRFLDNVIDKDSYFLEETKLQQQRLRRVGLSVMGLADALVRLGIRYGSPESEEFVERVFRTMKDAAIQESIQLGFEKGVAKAWDKSMWDRPYLKEWLDRTGWSDDPINPTPMVGLRNIFLLTQAPTGTTSLLAGVNSGIEPYFNLKTWREDRTGGRYVYALAVEESLGGTITETDSLPSYVVTSKDVSVEEHIAIQAAVQRYVDSSVSKTVNAPKDQTVDEAKKAFMLAYDSGLKGIAYYRDGSRDVQVLYHESPNEVIARLEQKVNELQSKLTFRERAATTEPDRKVIEGPDLCPDCSVGTIVYEEGCRKCYGCGWSAC